MGTSLILGHDPDNPKSLLNDLVSAVLEDKAEVIPGSVYEWK